MSRALPENDTQLARLKRLLALVPMARLREGVSIDKLLALFDCDVDTLFADIRLLIMCGVPPYGPGDYIQAYIEDGRLFMKFADRFARPVRLNAEEYSALACTVEYIGALLGGQRCIAEDLLEKLSAAKAPNQDLADLPARMLCSGKPAEKKLALMKNCAESRTKIAVEYYSVAAEEVRRRVLRPYAIIVDSCHWYVLAHCELRGGIRFFRGDRILDARPLAGRFEVPDDFDAGDYAVPRVFESQIGATEIQVRFAPEYARFISERFPPERLEKGKDGSVVLSMKSEGIPWAARWVMKHGRYARALSPPELVAEVKSRCDDILAIYD